MASIADDLISRTPARHAPVAYFFCRYDLADSLMARTILGSLVRQLLERTQDLKAAKTLLNERTLQLDSDDLRNFLEQAFPKD